MELLAACHLHSAWSYDGSWSLEMLAAKFSGRGCRVIMMTEHDRGFSESRLMRYRAACAEVSSSSLLVLPGIEYSDANNCVHILVWGPVPFLGECVSTNDVLEAVKAAGGVAVLAHPSRRAAWKFFDPSWGSRLLGVEVWNRKYDGWAPSQIAHALRQDVNAIPFVGMDFHTHRQSFPLFMALEADGNVTEENILRGLKSRRCYPQAFGLPLSHSLFSRAERLLSFAEGSRRLAASIVRYSRPIMH
jgi:predicted metal-dependent phosphoesterase TrpH